MRQAASLEASTDKHALTPGEVLPAAELYGDLLYELGRFDESLEAYRSALRRAPGRFNSLYGAGIAANATGDKLAAESYFAELLSIVGSANNQRSQIDEVRSILSDK